MVNVSPVAFQCGAVSNKFLQWYSSAPCKCSLDCPVSSQCTLGQPVAFQYTLAQGEGSVDKGKITAYLLLNHSRLWYHWLSHWYNLYIAVNIMKQPTNNNYDIFTKGALYEFISWSRMLIFNPIQDLYCVHNWRLPCFLRHIQHNKD